MKRMVLAFLSFYKKAISPYLGNNCRFSPTCSEYAKGAVERFGVLKGSLLAIWRILRCNPFCKGGYDPVPERFTFKRAQQQLTEEN